MCALLYNTIHQKKKGKKGKKTIYSSLKGLEKFPASAAWENIYTCTVSLSSLEKYAHTLGLNGFGKYILSLNCLNMYMDMYMTLA